MNAKMEKSAKSRDCTECGPGVAFDEDGCCVACGSPTVPATTPAAAIDIRLLVTAQPGLSHAEVASYIRMAVEQYSGCLRGDDPCRSIHVTRVQHLGWVDAED